MKILISESQFRNLLGESYKFTFADKKNIDNIIKTEYKKYKNGKLRNQESFWHYTEAKKVSLQNLKKAIDEYIPGDNEKLLQLSNVMENNFFIKLPKDTPEKNYIDTAIKIYKNEKFELYKAIFNNIKPVPYYQFYKDNYDDYKKKYVHHIKKNYNSGLFTQNFLFSKSYEWPEVEFINKPMIQPNIPSREKINKVNPNLIEYYKKTMSSDDKTNIENFLRYLFRHKDNGKDKIGLYNNLILTPI